MHKYANTPGYYYDCFGVYRQRGSGVGALTDAEKTAIIDYWRFERNNTDHEIAAHFEIPKSVVAALIDAYIRTLKIGFK